MVEYLGRQGALIKKVLGVELELCKRPQVLIVVEMSPLATFRPSYPSSDPVPPQDGTDGMLRERKRELPSQIGSEPAVPKGGTFGFRHDELFKLIGGLSGYPLRPS
jgi:hypothetical protein